MNYPAIDLSRMFEHPKCAVRCRTLEEARTLIYNFHQQYPRKADYFDLDDPGWDNHGSETAYTLFYSDDDKPTTLSRTECGWFEDEGYEVVEFTELANPVEIEESDMPLEALFGWKQN